MFRWERVDDNQVVEAKTPNTVEADVQFSDFYIKNEFICLKKYKLNLPQNGEDFKILRTLLLKKQAVRHEELWRELYNEDCRNINLKDYIKDHVCKIRKVIKKHGYDIINKDKYLEITK